LCACTILKGGLLWPFQIYWQYTHVRFTLSIILPHPPPLSKNFKRFHCSIFIRVYKILLKLFTNLPLSFHLSPPTGPYPPTWTVLPSCPSCITCTFIIQRGFAIVSPHMNILYFNYINLPILSFFSPLCHYYSSVFYAMFIYRCNVFTFLLSSFPLPPPTNPQKTVLWQSCSIYVCFFIWSWINLHLCLSFRSSFTYEWKHTILAFLNLAYFT
jgi:hypothetical protein